MQREQNTSIGMLKSDKASYFVGLEGDTRLAAQRRNVLTEALGQL